ncbi:hypothetical protein C4564_04925 [Candidatus Microgenomates bacterium]|nr:MAG: hypothetical protein C4564_04925 [Candidatus Microgenomates bacterium]
MQTKLQKFVENNVPVAPAGVYVVRWTHEVKPEGVIYTPYDGINFRTDLVVLVPFPEGEHVIELPIPSWVMAVADMFGDADVVSAPMFASEAKAAGEAYIQQLNEFLTQLG